MIFFIYHFHNFADKDKDKNQDKEFGAITWSCDLVTQLTFLDKLRNSNHDIGGSVTDSQRVIAFAMFFYFRLCWIETIIRAHISFSDVLFITIPLMWNFPVLSSQLRGRSCNETSFLKSNIPLLLLILTSWTLWANLGQRLIELFSFAFENIVPSSRLLVLISVVNRPDICH